MSTGMPRRRRANRRAFLSLGTAMLVLTGLGGCSPEHRTISRWDSPNHKLVAFLVESVAGGEGSVREDIYVNDEGLPPNQDNPVFTGVGCSHLSYDWVNDYTLQIHYETTCAISHFTNRWSRPSDVAVGRPNPIEIVLVRS